MTGSMTFDEFKILVKGMKSVYTADNFLPDADSVKIWYALLKDIPYKVMNTALQKYIMTERFAPTVADLRKMCVDISEGSLPDWSEGWEQVLRSIRNYGYYREDEALASLDDLTRTCVQRMGFRNICMTENINVERANFRMIYEQMANRRKVEEVLAPDVRARIAEYTSRNLIAEKGGAE